MVISSFCAIKRVARPPTGGDDRTLDALDLLFAVKPVSERMHQAALTVLFERAPLLRALMGEAAAVTAVTWEPDGGAFDLMVETAERRTLLELEVDSDLSRWQVEQQLAHPLVNYRKSARRLAPPPRPKQPPMHVRSKRSTLAIRLSKMRRFDVARIARTSVGAMPGWPGIFPDPRSRLSPLAPLLGGTEQVPTLALRRGDDHDRVVSIAARPAGSGARAVREIFPSSP